MSLHYMYLVKLEMPIEDVLPLSCYRQKIQNSSHLICGLKIRKIWIQLITTCGKYCKKGLQNRHHWSGAIDDAIDELLPQWRHDAAWATPFSVAVSVCSYQWCVFCTPSLAIFPI